MDNLARFSNSFFFLVNFMSYQRNTEAHQWNIYMPFTDTVKYAAKTELYCPMLTSTEYIY